jgi:hypothetical protein
VEFEPTITASERAKTVHALDSSATVTGSVVNTLHQIPAGKNNPMRILLSHVKQFNSEVRLLHCVALKLTEQGCCFEIARHCKNIKYKV